MKHWITLAGTFLVFFLFCSLPVYAAEPQAPGDTPVVTQSVADPVDPPVDPVDPPVDPADPPVDPVDPPVDPADPPVDPVDPPVDPVDPPVDPVDPPVDPVDPPVDPVDPPVDPVDPPVDPVDPPVDPADPPVDPADPPVDPVDPPVDPVDPPVDPVTPSGWQLQEDGTWRYFSQDGVALTGWQLLDGAWFYLDPATGTMLSGQQQIDGETQLFAANGAWQAPQEDTLLSAAAVKNGWLFENGKWYYYANGVKKTGWFAEGDTWYYLGTKGAMQTGWLADHDNWYFLNRDGTMNRGWMQDAGAWYFLNHDGSMNRGWLQDAGAWYFNHQNGAMATGWLKQGATRYFLNANGSMATGWLAAGSNWYYLTPGNGNMATGWLADGGNWYYLTPRTGKMAAGWSPAGTENDWFYFEAGGKMFTGWLAGGGSWYYLKPGAGNMATGWLADGGDWYYLAPGTGKMVTGWLDGNGPMYYLHEGTGKMATGWVKIGSAYYRFYESDHPASYGMWTNPVLEQATVYDYDSEQYCTGTIDDIVAHIVMYEVGDMNNPEVLKAHAVATLSWLLHLYEFYPDSTPYVWLWPPSAAVSNAVKAVSGIYLSYAEHPALAMSSYSSAGVTNSGNTFYSDYLYPYLSPVPDPNGATDVSHVEVWNATQMAAAIKEMIGITPTGNPSTWVQVHGVGGYITGATVCGYEVTAATFYLNLWPLYSPYITSWTYDNTRQTWTAYTTGNGHGVGMSYTGASYYAKNGWKYNQILANYFPGTVFTRATA